MSVERSAFQGPRVRGPWRFASWAVVIVLIGAWFWMFAPTGVGGRTTFALVDGTSMQPMLHTGDLAIAHTADEYHVGDLVMFRVNYGLVIHRIVGGSAVDGWTTQGDNRDAPDPWVVNNDQIQGRYWTSVPRVGTVLAWVARNPWLFTGGFTFAAALVFLPWHRRRMEPELRDALASAQRDPSNHVQPAADTAVLIASAAGAFACLTALGHLALSGDLSSLRGAAVGAGLLVSAGSARVLCARLYDGVGEAEPMRTYEALSGRLRLVAALPELHEPAAHVGSPLELRRVAEKYRVPVLHHIDAATGTQSFLVISPRGAGLWVVDDVHAA